MLAAERSRADLLRKWYHIPGILTDYSDLPEALHEVYKQRISSYIVQDNEGNNALMRAIKSGNSACFPFLLSPETAAILNQKDNEGKTALIHAIESRNSDVIEEFLRVVAEVLSGVNQYDPGHEVKLEVDYRILNCIKSIKDNKIKSQVEKCLDGLAKHIYYTDMPKLMPVSKLKSNSTTDTMPTIHKSPKKVETIPGNIMFDVIDMITQVSPSPILKK
ncbi:ankyrin repeat domain-containing protein [Wolbachia endosymbiont (group E) of Neria commutata]|uniref:ankyrin repeat domain-containing protein n=1 Tax=Wolbachia endosymbiont (group E) of Neria commutata TaxID=3066149 RepID=UPI00313330AB